MSDKKDKKEKKRQLKEETIEEPDVVEPKKAKKEKKEKKSKKDDEEVQLTESKATTTKSAQASGDDKIFPLADTSLTAIILEAVQQANHYKLLKRGANESAKTLNRGTSELIILTADADPLAIILHLPLICEDKNIPYVFIPSGAALGRACGVSRSVVAASIMTSDQSQLESLLKGIRNKIDEISV